MQGAYAEHWLDAIYRASRRRREGAPAGQEANGWLELTLALVRSAGAWFDKTWKPGGERRSLRHSSRRWLAPTPSWTLIGDSHTRRGSIGLSRGYSARNSFPVVRG